MRISKKKFIYRISISNLCWIWTGKSHLYEDSNRFDINTQMFVAMATKNYSTHSCVNTEDSSGYILLIFKHVITHSKKIVFCTNLVAAMFLRLKDHLSFCCHYNQKIFNMAIICSKKL